MYVQWLCAGDGRTSLRVQNWVQNCLQGRVLNQSTRVVCRGVMFKSETNHIPRSIYKRIRSVDTSLSLVAWRTKSRLRFDCRKAFLHVNFYHWLICERWRRGFNTRADLANHDQDWGCSTRLLASRDRPLCQIGCLRHESAQT